MTATELIRQLAISSDILLPDVSVAKWGVAGQLEKTDSNERLAAILEPLRYRFDVACFVGFPGDDGHIVHLGLATSDAFEPLATAKIDGRDSRDAWRVAAVCSAHLESLIFHQETSVIVQLQQQAAAAAGSIKSALPHALTVELCEQSCEFVLLDAQRAVLGRTPADIVASGDLSVRYALDALQADVAHVGQALGKHFNARSVKACANESNSGEQLLAAA